ncbi:MAG: Helix-turn-helix domain [Bacteroidota bacterium]|jgi:transcriptional regulator with XRE-family HTH domain
MMPHDKDMVVKLIGERIRKLRIESQFTLEALAFKADMDYTQLSRIELGKINTSIFQIHKIALALNTSTSAILTALDLR